MCKRANNRFVVSNKCIEPNPACIQRKCAHHIYSYNYAANMRRYDEITATIADQLLAVDIVSTINVGVIFHFLAPVGSFDRDRVVARAYDVIQSVNDDFNNYSPNPNTMNNFKYRSIINQIFIDNMAKQNIYLSPEYVSILPILPSNITFTIAQIYFYPVCKRLDLTPFNDICEVEMEFQAIKQYIHLNRADAILPLSFLNIYIIDMTGTSILGFSNFPWEVIDNYHGVMINRRAFFPEDYGEVYFACYKTFTHEIGHYFGLLHVVNNDAPIGAYGAANLHVVPISDQVGNYIINTPNQCDLALNPVNKIVNARLHTDLLFNPLFMDFMDYTYDRYVAIFTLNQMQIMRYMISIFRPLINTLVNPIIAPIPQYNPVSDTFIGAVNMAGPGPRLPPLLPPVSMPPAMPPAMPPPLPSPYDFSNVGPANQPTASDLTPYNFNDPRTFDPPPSSFVNQFNPRVDDEYDDNCQVQIQPIPMPDIQSQPQPLRTISKNKFNKYGQLIMTDGDVQLRTTHKRFTRTKPVN